MRSMLIAATLCVGPILGGCAARGVVTSNDTAQLLALHEQAMEAHRKGDVEILLQADSADFVLANRGAISRPSLGQRRNSLGPYLKSVKFSEYVDMVPPVVKVSADGTLGWVIVQIRANGTSANGDGRTLQFQSAWIELYEKQGGEWRRTGNVSNFK
jgi:hypothetical protein